MKQFSKQLDVCRLDWLMVVFQATVTQIEGMDVEMDQVHGLTMDGDVTGGMLVQQNGDAAGKKATSWGAFLILMREQFLSD